MPSALISNLALASVETLNSTIAGKETIRARVVRGFVKREREKIKKKRKAVECKCYGPRYTATYFSFQKISRFDILLSVYTWSKISSRRASKFLFRVATPATSRKSNSSIWGPLCGTMSIGLERGRKGIEVMLSDYVFFSSSSSFERQEILRKILKR